MNFISAGPSATNPGVPAWLIVVGIILASCNSLGLLVHGIIVLIRYCAEIQWHELNNYSRFLLPDWQHAVSLQVL